MATNYPVNPRVRAYGKARIDIAQRAKTSQDWIDLWKQPAVSFPFTWGVPWKQCIEYKVDDFAAEVGFYIDVMGLPINAFDPDYAMFTSPRADFYFSVVPTPPGLSSTPPDAIRIQFMVDDILTTTDELQSRGIFFDQPPQPCQPSSSLYIACFRTPHGISIDLWGAVKQEQGPISYEDADTGLAYEGSEASPPGDSDSEDADSEEVYQEPVGQLSMDSDLIRSGIKSPYRENDVRHLDLKHTLPNQKDPGDSQPVLDSPRRLSDRKAPYTSTVVLKPRDPEKSVPEIVYEDIDDQEES